MNWKNDRWIAGCDRFSQKPGFWQQPGAIAEFEREPRFLNPAIADLSALATQYPEHHGIILATHSSWNLSELIKALDHLLSETQSEDWLGQVRWLNQRQFDELPSD